MRFHAESSRDAYDVIVVGAGIGGLTAAALLARTGRDVLVVERHDRVGGYAHSFRRGRYLFDAAVHLVGGCAPVSFEGGGLLHRVLSSVGADRECDFARVDPFYSVGFPDATLDVSTGLDEFVRVHAELVPDERKGLKQFAQECLNIRQEVYRASELAASFSVGADSGRFPTLLHYRRATLGHALDAHLDSPRAKALLGALWPYLGLPPSRVSFLYFATMLMSYVVDGAFYCRGSFQRFADALAGSVVDCGGEVLLRSSVRRIVVEAGCARGVMLENGQQISAPLVFSNIDAVQTAQELVGTEVLPSAYCESLRALEPSHSAFVVYMAGRFGADTLPRSHETFLYSDWDHDAAYASTLAADPSWLSVTVPSHIDPAAAPAGEDIVTLTTLMPRRLARPWRDEKQPMVERMLDLAERSLPGLRDGAVFTEGGSPRTMERYTRNSGGAIYGWETSPAQVGLGRSGFDMPVEGLHLVGHWAQPGGGVYGVVSSGVQAARRALGLASEKDLWRLLAGPVGE